MVILMEDLLEDSLVAVDLLEVEVAQEDFDKYIYYLKG
jgi:hypothetical protein